MRSQLQSIDPGRAYDRTLFESPLVRVGKFRCPVGHPRFGEASSPTETRCFVFPRSAVWIEHEGAAPFVADVNTVPVYNAGAPYLRRPIDASGDRSDWFAVAPEILREMVERYVPPMADSEALFPFCWARSSAATYLEQRQIFRYVRDNPVHDTLFVEESVITLANAVLKGADVSGKRLTPRRDPSARRKLADCAREFLAQNYSTNAGLSLLAREVGSSVFHLCRVFKEQTGLAIHQYRTHLRLRRSLELLDNDSADILDVAIRVGFSGHSHYTRTFHTLFGLTPSRFKNDPLARLHNEVRRRASFDPRWRIRAASNLVQRTQVG